MLGKGFPAVYRGVVAIIVLGTVESKVVEGPTGAPLYTVSPAHDLRIFRPDVDRTGGEHPALESVEPAGEARDEAAPGGFEYEQSVDGGLDPARPGRS